MTLPINAKGKPFSWSYSADNDFRTCPFQYAHKRFYCTIPYEESEATIWGNRVHKAAELSLKNLPHRDDEAFAPVQKYVDFMLRSGYIPLAEVEIALTQDLKSTKWFAKDVWLRIKIDVVLLDYKRTEAKLFDWKTGGTIKDDEDQLRLCGAGLSIVEPRVESFEGKYIWTKHQQVTGIRPFTRSQVPLIWEDFLARAARMENAWRTETFQQRPNGLCKKWCPVKVCQHCGGGR